jgi:outer membrane murein-binding lipoprotein Lpp
METRMNKNVIAASILVVGLSACATVAYVAHGAFSRLDKIEKLAQQIPELTEKVDRFADGVEKRVQSAREALPATADEIGSAGARAYGVFRKLTKGDEEAETSDD